MRKNEKVPLLRSKALKKGRIGVTEKNRHWKMKRVQKNRPDHDQTWKESTQIWNTRLLQPGFQYSSHQKTPPILKLKFIHKKRKTVLHMKQGGMVRIATAHFSKLGKFYFFLNHKSNYHSKTFWSGPNNSPYNFKNN